MEKLQRFSGLARKAILLGVGVLGMYSVALLDRARNDALLKKLNAETVLLEDIIDKIDYKDDVPDVLKELRFATYDEALAVLESYKVPVPKPEPTQAETDRKKTLAELKAELEQEAKDKGGSIEPRQLHEELQRIGNAIASVHQVHQVRLQTADAQKQTALADTSADLEAIEQRWRDDRTEILASEQDQLGPLLVRERDVITRLRQVEFDVLSWSQQKLRHDRRVLEYQRLVQLQDLDAAAGPDNSATKKLEEEVRRAFIELRETALADRRTELSNKKGLEGLAAKVVDHENSAHVVYELSWYSALVIGIVALSAFIFSAIVQLISLPRTTTLIEERVGELLEKVPMRGEALKTIGASVIAGVVGYQAFTSAVERVPSSPQRDGEDRSIALAQWAWPNDLETPIFDGAHAAYMANSSLAANPARNGRDGADGRDGKDGRDGRDGRESKDRPPCCEAHNGNDGAPGRDGRDGVNGRDGNEGPQGPPGTPVDVWTTSIKALEGKQLADDEQISTLHGKNVKHGMQIGDLEDTLKSERGRIDNLIDENRLLQDALKEESKKTDAVIEYLSTRDDRPPWSVLPILREYRVSELAYLYIDRHLSEHVSDKAAQEELLACLRNMKYTSWKAATFKRTIEHHRDTSTNGKVLNDALSPELLDWLLSVCKVERS